MTIPSRMTLYDIASIIIARLYDAVQLDLCYCFAVHVQEDYLQRSHFDRFLHVICSASDWSHFQFTHKLQSKYKHLIEIQDQCCPVCRSKRTEHMKRGTGFTSSHKYL